MSDDFENRTMTLQELESQPNGAGMKCAFIVFIAIPTFALGIEGSQYLPEISFPLALAILIVESIIGMAIIVQNSNKRYYTYSVGILQLIGPPEPVITEKYAVTERDGVYIFLTTKSLGTLYFVALKYSEPIPNREIDVRKVFWKWNSTLDIQGLRVHDVEGEFTIPTPDGELITGKGLLLAVPLLGRSYILRVPEFSREQLLAVVDYASQFTEKWSRV